MTTPGWLSGFSAIRRALSPGLNPGPAGMSPKNETPGIAKFPDGAGHNVPTGVSEPPRSGMTRTLRGCPLARSGKSKRTMARAPPLISAIRFWRASVFKNGASSPHVCLSRVSSNLSCDASMPACRSALSSVCRESMVESLNLASCPLLKSAATLALRMSPSSCSSASIFRIVATPSSLTAS